MNSRIDRAIAAAICIVVTAVTLAFSFRQGITRDEAYYMDAGERYIRYFEDLLTGRLERPLADRSILPYWEYNAEHPPFMKLMYGLSWRVLHRCTCVRDQRWHPEITRINSGRHTTLSLLPEVAAFRLPTMVTFGLLCALVYLFFVEALGSRRGGLAAALLMFAQPRAFFHAQTASFDLPAATFWLATTYAYWRALRSETWRDAFVTGALFSLFLATKLQSFLLPAALAAHWLWLACVRHRAGRGRPTVKPFAMMGLLAPVATFALWPWLWHDTIARFRLYLSFHWNHVHYNFEYLGRNYNHPPYPWHEPLVMLLFTAPVVLLVLAAAGVALLARRSAPLRIQADDHSIRALMLAAGFVPVAVFMLGTQPIYGETKHWLATMPFLALAAGYAVDRVGSALERELNLRQVAGRMAVSAALVAIVFAPAAAETLRSHPYGLSHYNALAGGAPGGADLGMNRQFWGYSVFGLLPWLNEHLPPNAKVFLHDSNHDSYELYMRMEQLRPDIVDAGIISEPSHGFTSDAALVVHEKHFNEFDYAIWETYGHVQPAQVLTLDGVPLVSVYLRSGATP
jgi:4-amino-4-deoxy-L-arabinose transferase-like glycosyltransferase